MISFQRLTCGILLVILLNGFLQCQSDQNKALDWPEISKETKPWTRWWWHGSAVNKTDLTRLLEEYARTGFGGVEITPIYGVHGYEDQFIDYLSPRWMDMLMHTLTEADRLQLGVDMATGTGWPFGGPWIGPDHAPKRLVHQVYQLQSGERLTEPVTRIQDPLVRAVRHRVSLDTLDYPLSENDNLQTMALEQVRYDRPLPLLSLMAFSEQDSVLELTSRIDRQVLNNLNSYKICTEFFN
ncbi:MAG: hypothetical protein GF372_11135 [Candidatus Marinimicrobia bacterium]|nr:hypothetical protein [Candidatus Neomarinimicrobiota bacterium]